MPARARRRLAVIGKGTLKAAPMALFIAMMNVGVDPLQAAVPPAQVGSGFTVMPADLAGNTAQCSLSNGCATVEPGNSCTANVQFAPITAGLNTININIFHNAEGSLFSVTATGTGIAASATATTATTADTNFGGDRGVRVGLTVPRNIVVRNTGTAPLIITSASAPAPFAVTGMGSCASSVNPGRSCSLSASFTPNAAQSYSRSLTIESNASNNPTALLTGRGR